VSIVLTTDQFARATGARIDRAQTRLVAYTQAMAFYNIDTRLRIAFLLANVGHESGGFAFTREIWNPAQVPAQGRYEGREDLGNNQPGDGFRFRGAGDIERTGRKNFALARDRLRAKFPAIGVPDFEADPDQLADPKWSALSACDFIDMVGGNQYADAMNFDGYCDLINRGHVTLAPGDSNGFGHRLNLALIGLRVLP
jgi:putative chitinase